MNTMDISSGGNGVYVLSWNFTATDIVFKVEARSTGWVGFGISPNGGMSNSDMILAWTNSNGGVEFRDAHTDNSFIKSVTYDITQNWKKLFYLKANGKTTVIFTRKLRVCNPDQAPNEINIDIAPTQYVIYAYGDAFLSGTPTYHFGNRGSKSVPLLAALNQKITLNPSEIETYDYMVDTVFKPQQTEYFCQMYKLPDSFETSKRHIVRFDTIIPPGHEKYVHHWVFFECSQSFETEYLAENPFPTPGTCSGTKGSTVEWGKVEQYCTKGTLAWATGGDINQYIPENLGYPVGENEFKYFYVQWHYENTDLDEGVRETGGLRFHFTQNYRPVEFGTFGLGALIHPSGLAIPPKAKALNMEYLCRKNNMNKLLANGDITVFASFPHTHDAGVSLYTKQVRNGREIAHISNNKYYDNKYQYINYLQTPVVLKKDDELSLTCVYNTEYTDKFVLGGLGTTEEMCLDALWYYPRTTAIQGCVDFPNGRQWFDFFDNLNKTGEIKWSFNGTYDEATFFENSFKDIEASPLITQSARLEKMLQDFYDNVNRTTYYDGRLEEHGPVRLIRMTEEPCTTTGSTVSPVTSNPFSNAARQFLSPLLLVASLFSAYLVL